jgi:hypothetical protein
MSEDQGDYKTGTETNHVKDGSNDRKYFIITPRIVKAFSRNPYDLALWDTVKDVAGDNGECYLSTEQLAALSGMSAGKASDSRKYWVEIGFLEGEIRKDPGYPQPVWHITVPDLWQKNIEWCEKYPKIADRIKFIESLHLVKPSPGEGGTSPHEGGTSPHEGKKNKKKSNKADASSSASALPAKPKANDFPSNVLYREVTGYYPPKATWYRVLQLMNEVETRIHRPPTREDLFPFFESWCARGWLTTSVVWLEYASRGVLPTAKDWNDKHALVQQKQMSPSELERARAEADRLFGVA